MVGPSRLAGARSDARLVGGVPIEAAASRCCRSRLAARRTLPPARTASGRDN